MAGTAASMAVRYYPLHYDGSGVGGKGSSLVPTSKLFQLSNFSHSSDSLLVTPGDEEGVARDPVAIAFPAEQAPQKGNS
jgi:hypothetical protein